jgi:hypothetical protein
MLSYEYIILYLCIYFDPRSYVISHKNAANHFFTIGCLIYLARRLKLAPMHASRLGISGDTPFAHECCKSTKLWPINGHIFMFWAMSWL